MDTDNSEVVETITDDSVPSIKATNQVSTQAYTIEAEAEGVAKRKAEAVRVQARDTLTIHEMERRQSSNLLDAAVGERYI